jgi:hypothetical protein
MTITLTSRLRLAVLGTAAAALMLVPSVAAQRTGARPLQAGDAHRALGLRGGELLTLAVDRTPGVPVVLALTVDGEPGVLALTPHSLQASGYRLLVESADGSFSAARASTTRTLRGELLGVPGSMAAASMLDDGLHVRIQMPDGRDVWLEPLVGRVSGASSTQYVIYRGDDVLDLGRTCGTDALPDAMLHATPGKTAVGDAEAGTGLKVAQLACDADYEYYLDWGSVTAVENRIHSVVNTMNLQYERDVGITHEITTILVRTSASQPYTSTNASTLLNQFRSQWNASHGNIVRDVAQLFTGKSIDGSTIGIAWVGVVCNLSYAYGVVESDFNSNFAYATDLSAHELGHNWGANHCTCTSYTMNPYITATNKFNPVGTIPTISAFRDAANCLTDGGGDPPPPPPPPEPGANLANADHSTGIGTISSGSYLSTHQSDNAYEALRRRPRRPRARPVPHPRPRPGPVRRDPRPLPRRGGTTRQHDLFCGGPGCRGVRRAGAPRRGLHAPAAPAPRRPRRRERARRGHRQLAPSRAGSCPGPRAPGAAPSRRSAPARALAP